MPQHRGRGHSKLKTSARPPRRRRHRRRYRRIVARRSQQRMSNTCTSTTSLTVRTGTGSVLRPSLKVTGTGVLEEGARRIMADPPDRRAGLQLAADTASAASATVIAASALVANSSGSESLEQTRGTQDLGTS
eukprot:scaffold16956_cov40-Prasinocladus_malaysianus.AAC.3